MDDRGPALSIVVYDSGWDARFSSEAEAIRAAISPARCFIDHVGSSAVKGAAGKPTIDVLLTLREWSELERVIGTLADLGYEIGEHVEGADEHVFMTKREADGRPKFHLHLVPRNSVWGQRMLVFRDELTADRDLAERYIKLKRELAVAHPHDLGAYTRGKDDFIRTVLREASGAFGIDRLLTHQRAELNRSQSLQILVVGAQFVLAVLAATSVFVHDGATLLNLAGLGFILVACRLWLGRIQRRHRSTGDQARRVVLIASGLGEQVSAEQRLRIFDRFTVSITGRPLMREESYFASRSEPGHHRLAELIQESAYWTRDLQQTSAIALRVVLLGVGILAGLVLWRSVPALPTETQISLARVLIALLVFILSSDVLGAMFAHEDAAKKIGEILHRVETAAARGYQACDVLLLMSDYNAAVESAPVTLPGVYKLRGRKLTRRWRSYLENKRLPGGA